MGDKELFSFKLSNLHKTLIERLVKEGRYDSTASFIRESIREKLKKHQEKGEI